MIADRSRIAGAPADGTPVMTEPRTDPAWLVTFADPAILSDLFAAARDCMAQVCEHDPAECGCPENRMTMVEFSEWVELEVRLAARTPVRLDQRENRKAGQRVRRSLEMAAG